MKKKIQGLLILLGVYLIALGLGIVFFKIKKKEPRYVLDSSNPLKIIARCPKCKQRMRLPNKEGKHQITCPKCNKQFKLKIK